MGMEISLQWLVSIRRMAKKSCEALIPGGFQDGFERVLRERLTTHGSKTILKAHSAKDRDNNLLH